jgi:general secretion pathway protein G
MDRLPKDPWGNDYQYLNPGTRSEIDIFSFGADGRRGGEGINAEIGNWNLDQL